jgi:hypothetical protein
VSVSQLDHEGARRMMAQAVQGRLDQNAERDLAMHLVGCPECKSLYEGLQHAHPALSSLRTGSPPTTAVDEAVRRATIVLGGEADPGPLGRQAVELGHSVHPTDEQPILTHESIEPFATEEQPDDLLPEVVAALPEDPVTEVPPLVTEPPPLPVIEPPAEPIEPVEPEPVAPQVDLPDLPAAVEPIDVHVIRTEPPPLQPTGPLPDADLPELFEPVVREPEPSQPIPVPTPTPSYAQTQRPDEVEQLFQQEYELERMAREPEARERPRTGPGPWLAAIAVTIALAVLAGVLITRGQGIIGGNLPSVSEVRRRVGRVFTEMDSLKATFTIRRLSLYRIGSNNNSLRYSFSDGRFGGRLVFDRAEGYREEVRLNVGDQLMSNEKAVQKTKETRSLLTSGQGSVFNVATRPPLAPPDGAKLRTSLGLLEQAVGAPARILVGADDLKVIGKTSRGGRDLYEVQFTVLPNELSRADRIEAFLDARTFFPIVVQRSISKGNAGVLGPPNVLSADAISTAFGNRQRVTTELVELNDVVLDDIILPGDFVLDTPTGVEPKTTDYGYDRITRAELSTKVKGFKPLLPADLPTGYHEQTFAVFSGKPAKWGPGGTYPAADGIFEATYFDGKTSIAISERHIPSGPFALKASPLQTGGLPITIRSETRAEKKFYYGWSPEVPPHAYGFLGNTFAVVSGYAPAADLLRIVASLSENPEAPAPLQISPSPGTSPAPSASP